jgi:hypothetical protein
LFANHLAVEVKSEPDVGVTESKSIHFIINGGQPRLYLEKKKEEKTRFGPLFQSSSPGYSLQS